MSRIALFLLCVAILVQSVQRTWIVASWKAKQEYITAELCEKRFEKNSCCAGSCYLNKELEKKQTEEKSAPTSEKKQTEYVCEVFTFLFEQQLIPTSYTFPILWSHGEPLGHGRGIFHPPALLG